MLAWIGIEFGLVWVGDFVGGLLGDVSSLGAMVFALPFLFSSLFLSVIGGSGVLSHGAVFGLCFLFFSIFFFLWTLGLF